MCRRQAKVKVARADQAPPVCFAEAQHETAVVIRFQDGHLSTFSVEGTIRNVDIAAVFAFGTLTVGVVRRRSVMEVVLSAVSVCFDC